MATTLATRAEMPMKVGRFVKWGSRKDSPGWVIQANGCHIWTGARTPKGYGSVSVDGKRQYVYRIRYEREIGPIPPELVLDHIVCDNPRCVNPRHVRPTTQRVNVLRGRGPTARNARKTHCPQGHLLDGDNLVRSALTRGSRNCRSCQIERDRKRPYVRRSYLACSKCKEPLNGGASNYCNPCGAAYQRTRRAQRRVAA